MRWIRPPVCQCCDRADAVQVVFESIVICDECRQLVIEWMRLNGFSLARPHPFTDKFVGVSGPPIRLVLPVEK